MAFIFGLIIGTFSPSWGHTWISQGHDKIYALKSLPEGSSLLVYELSKESCDDGFVSPVNFTEKQGINLIGEYRTPGKHSCHITILKHQIILSDYTSGTLSLFDIDESGIPANDTAQIISFPVRNVSGNIDPVRQATPHVHSSWISPDGNKLITVDLGSDRLYCFDINDGKISSTYHTTELPEGCGPRHCLFSGDILYISTEISDEVLVYSYPEMKLIQRCCSNEIKPQGGSHLLLSPDKKYMYVSSRLKNDGIAIFKVKADGTLSKQGYQKTGIHPRHFSISADGAYIAVACRDSNVVEIYSRNPETGLLTKESDYKIQKPVYVDFFNTKTK